MLARREAAIVVAVSLVICAAAAGCRPAPAAGGLTEADRTAIRALDTAFVQGWVRDDTAAVLRLFDARAVLFPPGSSPVAGIAAIKAYWWPTDGSHTHIAAFTRDIVEIEGGSSMAYMRGAASLSWEYVKDGKRSAQTSRSTDLVIMERGVDGRWRITRQMWSTLP